ncbi:MAG: STAS domain-containing protein [Chlorobium sp.]|jgi:anti-anti-sigma factor|nr:STAS domain-containing protein [Chlorobium sp.]
MKNSVSSRKDLTILKIEEEVFDFRHAAFFRQTIENLVSNENSKNLIIDFSHVKAIDSSGISSMLLAHQLSNQCQGLAIFVALCQQIKDLLKLTNLDKQLYIFSSINEVMTLVEPTKKNKRGARGKVDLPPDEPVDDICFDLEIIPETALTDEHMEHALVDTDSEADEDPDNDPDNDLSDDTSDLSPEPQQKTGSAKKRGRPKKSKTGKSEKPENE